jgi:hypothetical protein
MKLRKRRESDIYISIAKLMALKYPNIVYRFDFAAGMKMSIGQARLHKSMNGFVGYPDLFIAYPNGKYAGLYLEIKLEGKKVFKKDGSLLMDEHLERQQKILHMLSAAGYYATFAIGIDTCLQIIQDYLKNKT